MPTATGVSPEDGPLESGPEMTTAPEDPLRAAWEGA